MCHEHRMRQKELRIALVCYGGISLAVYMHGVTKEVVLDVDGPTPPMKDPKGTQHRGLSATTSVNRSDYGMTFDVPMVGDQVAIQLDVEMVDKAPGPPRPAPGATPPPPPAN